MKQVTVNKAELLAKVKANRADHISAHAEAVEGYRSEVINVLEEAHVNAHTGAEVDFTKVLKLMRKPESHEKDYDRAILMLEMSAEDVITLQQVEFDQLVMDEWAWKGDFLSSTAIYGKK